MMIRDYQSGDVEKIIAFNDTVLKEFGFAFSGRLDRDVFNIPKYYTLRKGRYLLLVNGDKGKEKIIGSIALSKITNKVCKLRHFYLLPEYRGNGWGMRLYQRAMKFISSEGYKEIWLSSAPQFKDAIRFYERAGFKRSLKPLWHYRRAGLFYILKLDSSRENLR